MEALTNVAIELKNKYFSIQLFFFVIRNHSNTMLRSFYCLQQQFITCITQICKYIVLSYGVEAYDFEGELLESQISKNMSNWQKKPKTKSMKKIMQGGVEQMVDKSKNDMILCMPTIHLAPLTKIISFERDNMNKIPQICVINK